MRAQFGGHHLYVSGFVKLSASTQLVVVAFSHKGLGRRNFALATPFLQVSLCIWYCMWARILPRGPPYASHRITQIPFTFFPKQDNLQGWRTVISSVKYPLREIPQLTCKLIRAQFKFSQCVKLNQLNGDIICTYAIDRWYCLSA